MKVHGFAVCFVVNPRLSQISIPQITTAYLKNTFTTSIQGLFKVPQATIETESPQRPKRKRKARGLAVYSPTFSPSTTGLILVSLRWRKGTRQIHQN